MFRRLNKTRNMHQRAFTLVELVVVTVILAILGAVLVPALIGYIDRSRKGRYIQEVDSYRTAAQSIMTEYYAMKGHTELNGQNIYWTDGEEKEWGDKVLQLMGYGRGADNHEPYILVIGVGSPKSTSQTKLQQFSVYYVGYVATEKSPAVFYVNGEYIYTYPTDNPKYINSDKKTVNGTVQVKNTIVKPEGTNIEITYIVISNRTGQPNEGNGSFWVSGNKSLKNHAEPYFKG